MKGFVRGIAVLLALFALSAHAQDKTTLLTERDKASYMVGMDIAESNAPIGPDVDIAAFERAMRNAMAGKPPLIDDATARKTSEVLMARIGARNQPGAKLPDISKVDVGLLAGVEWGRRLAPIQDEIDMPVVMQAIRTAFSGGKPLLSAEEATIVRQEFDTKLNALAVTRAQQGADGNLKKAPGLPREEQAGQGRVHDQVRPAVHDPAPGRGHAPQAGRARARAVSRHAAGRHRVRQHARTASRARSRSRR